MSKKVFEQKEGGSAFSAAYAALNAAQKQAVDTIDGPVMVIAGPGTGKTQILTLRIANIIATTDTNPEHILALTFTEAGVVAMRNRLRTYLGSAAYRVPIHTFHGFAGELIRRYPDAYPTIIGGRPATDLERVTLVEDILAAGGIQKLRPPGNPAFYLRPVLSALQTLKREAVSPDDLAAHTESLQQALENMPRTHEKGAHQGKVRGEYTRLEDIITKNRELVSVYRAYEAGLRATQLYDFDDMILETVRAMKENESMLRDVQETYQYLLADEHQDVNGAQNELLDYIANYHSRPNVFVVGDEKQAIYRFQGASLENFLYFEDRFPGTTVISLTDNYRSGQRILDAAHSLIITGADERVRELRVPLTSALGTSAAVTEASYQHEAIEDQVVVDMVQAELAAGTTPADIVIIVRTNSEVEYFSTLLRQAGIGAVPSADSDILRHPLTTTVRQLITAVVSPEDDVALSTVLHGAYWGIAVADVIRLLAARRSGQTLTELLADTQQIEALALEDEVAVKRVGQVLTAARERMVDTAPQRVVADLLVACGLKSHVITHDPIESGRILRRLYDEMSRMVQTTPGCTLGQIAEQFTKLEQHSLTLSAPFIGVTDAGVAIMTAHKSKGLEFEVVIAPHLTDKQWGKGRSSEYFSLPLLDHLSPEAFDALDDERRLLYVLLTRAKRLVRLSWSTTNQSGTESLRSRLLEEIDEAYIEHIDSSAASFAPLSVIASETPTPVVSCDVLTTLFYQRGFSATSINNYLESPYSYLYRNILRVPEVQGLPLLYGTALHAVLESLTRSFKTDTPLTFAAVPEKLSEALRRLPLSAAEYAQLHERGLAALSAYWPTVERAKAFLTREEVSLQVLLPTDDPQLPAIPLSGKLDRVDLTEDGQARRVVDYKTGKPKTRNDIEGKTKQSTGAYKRQLVFYALLLSLHDDERLKTNTGVLSFVEPDTHGRIHEEVFDITPEEIAELKETIIQAARDFTSGTFLRTACDPTVCEYCELVASLQGR